MSYFESIDHDQYVIYRDTFSWGSPYDIPTRGQINKIFEVCQGDKIYVCASYPIVLYVYSRTLPLTIIQ